MKRAWIAGAAVVAALAQWPPEATFSREPMPVPYLASPPAVISIDTGRQLFVDDYLIERTDLRRSYHRPRPYEHNPVLTADQPWEQGPNGPMAMPFSDGVWYEPEMQRFRMWYLCAAPAGFATCYAESADGLKWIKPKLDVVAGTNIVLTAERDSTVVWRDADERDRRKRYKLLRSHAGADKTWGLSLHESADGIHWSDVVASSHGHDWVGDRTTLFYNPFRKVWVSSIRNSGRVPGVGRVRFYSEGAELSQSLAAWQPAPWVGADRLDPRHPKFPEVVPQLYNLDATPYESLMLGLFSVWEGPENNLCARLHIQKRNEIFTGFSRDGFHWQRPDRRPFMGVNETEGAWNWGNMQSVGGGLVVVNDQLYFYASGRRRNDQAWDAQASTGVFLLRRDGFASMDGTGTLTTRPVRFSGSHLFVNFSGAELRAEVLASDGNVLPLARSIAVGGDSTRAELRWRGASRAVAAGSPVRIRFHVRQGELYAFWVSGDEKGASNGYVAAGGPGFAGARDREGN